MRLRVLLFFVSLVMMVTAEHAWASCASFQELLQQWASARDAKAFLAHKQLWMTQELEAELVKPGGFARVSYQKKSDCHWIAKADGVTFDIQLDTNFKHTITINGLELDYTVPRTLKGIREALKTLNDESLRVSTLELFLPKAHAQSRRSANTPGPANFANSTVAGVTGWEACQNGHHMCQRTREDQQETGVKNSAGGEVTIGERIREAIPSLPACLRSVRADIGLSRDNLRLIGGAEFCTPGPPARDPAGPVPRQELERALRRSGQSTDLSNPQRDSWGGLRQTPTPAARPAARPAGQR